MGSQHTVELGLRDLFGRGSENLGQNEHQAQQNHAKREEELWFVEEFSQVLHFIQIWRSRLVDLLAWFVDLKRDRSSGIRLPRRQMRTIQARSARIKFQLSAAARSEGSSSKIWRPRELGFLRGVFHHDSAGGIALVAKPDLNLRADLVSDASINPESGGGANPQRNGRGWRFRGGLGETKLVVSALEQFRVWRSIPADDDESIHIVVATDLTAGVLLFV
jgi:hypothetical protein